VTYSLFLSSRIRHTRSKREWSSDVCSSDLQKQSYRFFDNTKTGHIMSRISNDLFEIGELAHHGPEDLFIAIMTFTGAFAIMFTINVKLALVILIMVPILIFLMAYSNIK